jgi:hypothetical protein
MKAIVKDHDFIRGLGRDATVVELDKDKLFALFWIVTEAVVKGRGCEEIGALMFLVAFAINNTTLTAQISVLNGLEAPSVAVPALRSFERPFAGEYIRAEV